MHTSLGPPPPLHPPGSGFALCSGPGLQFSCVFLKPVCQHQKKAEGWAPRSPLFSHSSEAPSPWPVDVCQAEVLAVGTCGSVGCPWSPVWHSTPRQTFSTCKQSCLNWPISQEWTSLFATSIEALPAGTGSRNQHAPHPLQCHSLSTSSPGTVITT